MTASKGRADVLYVIEASGAKSLYIVAIKTSMLTKVVEEMRRTGSDGLER